MSTLCIWKVYGMSAGDGKEKEAASAVSQAKILVLRFTQVQLYLGDTGEIDMDLVEWVLPTVLEWA